MRVPEMHQVLNLYSVLWVLAIQVPEEFDETMVYKPHYAYLVTCRNSLTSSIILYRYFLLGLGGFTEITSLTSNGPQDSQHHELASKIHHRLQVILGLQVFWWHVDFGSPANHPICPKSRRRHQYSRYKLKDVSNHLELPSCTSNSRSMAELRNTRKQLWSKSHPGVDHMGTLVLNEP